MSQVYGSNVTSLSLNSTFAFFFSAFGISGTRFETEILDAIWTWLNQICFRSSLVIMAPAYWRRYSIRFSNPKAHEVLSYTDMCLQAIEASWIRNLFAMLCSSVTLVGFLVFPNTFASVRLGKDIINSTVTAILKTENLHIPSLVLAPIFSFSGLVGTCVLWRNYRNNHIWLRGMFW